MKFSHQIFSSSVIVLASLYWVCPSFADGGSSPRSREFIDVGNLSNFELARYQYCDGDSDCMIVNNGCCDCNNGGEDVSINKGDLDRFKARMGCSHARCTKKGGRRCGSGVVSCVSHKCRYVGNDEFDAKGGELKRGD